MKTWASVDPEADPTIVDPLAPDASEESSTLLGVDVAVLEREQLRTRAAGLWSLLIINAVSALFFAFPPERNIGSWIACGMLATNCVASAVLIAVNRRRLYGDRTSAAIGVMAIIAVCVACAYTGIASMATIGFPLLVYYFGLADSDLRRKVPFIASMVGYGLVVLLVILDVLPAAGLGFQDETSEAHRLDNISQALFVELIIVITYVLARRSRRSTMLAMSSLEQARQRIEQQRALLEEARANFDRVIGSARAGRFTGRELGGCKLDDVIGRGAMGEVYAGTNEEGDDVAVKVLHAHVEGRTDSVDRFFREAEITSGLASPRIPRVLASGRGSDGAPYLVMERLRGADLSSILRNRRRLGFEETAELVNDIAEGLSAAHDADVVHRDVKPQNLFRTINRGWLILDFGVSRLLASGNTLTGGSAVGTPAYMAPEQAISSMVDARADVFSLGVVLYRAVTGRPAFSARTPALTMYAVHNSQPVRPGALRRDLPEAADLVLALALAKERDTRLATAQELAEAWNEALAGRLLPKLRRRAEAVVRAFPWGDSRPNTGESPLPR